VKLGNEETALRNDLAVLDRVIDIVANPEKHRLSLPCFARGTLVWTPAGLRPIEEIRVGDLVQAWDPESATLVQRRVLQVFHNRTLHFYEIAWGDAKVEATGRHRFWVEDRGEWIAAKNLVPGMQCRLPDGRTLEITSVRRRDAVDEETFNFQVDEVANYFVGPGVLVHNQGDEPIPSHLGGKFFVYLGFNAQERFAKFVYVGQTKQTVPKRQKQHQEFAKEQLLRTDLPPEQREFYEFMSEVELIPVVEGLTKPGADWVEQHNINLETEVRGESFVMNRREQITGKEHRDEIIRKLLEDPVVRKKYCPE
jgi:Pretoxin HINT domain